MLELGNLGAKAAPQNSEFIRDTTTAHFERDVIHASMQAPVVVQFWAPWCGPCKQLGPVLEKNIAAAKGAVTMVRVNIDQSPELAQALRVQSVPMVYAFHQGQPVDGFVGQRPDSEIKAFVARLMQAGGAAPEAPDLNRENLDKLMAQAHQFFRDGELTEAMAAYSTVLDQDPQRLEALAGIGWCFVAQGEMEAVAEIVAEAAAQPQPQAEAAPENAAPKNLAMQGLAFVLAQREAAQGIDAAALAVQLEKNPKDHDARYALAQARIGAGDLAGAVDALVELTRLDREWQDQKARRLLLDLIAAMGNDHPLTPSARRRLSSVLFS